MDFAVLTVPSLATFVFIMAFNNYDKLDPSRRTLQDGKGKIKPSSVDQIYSICKICLLLFNSDNKLVSKTVFNDLKNMINCSFKLY